MVLPFEVRGLLTCDDESGVVCEIFSLFLFGMEVVSRFMEGDKQDNVALCASTIDLKQQHTQ